MSVVTVVRALFPHAGARPARPRASSSGRLSHVVAIACALVPLAAMGQAFVSAV